MPDDDTPRWEIDGYLLAAEDDAEDARGQWYWHGCKMAFLHGTGDATDWPLSNLPPNHLSDDEAAEWRDGYRDGRAARAAYPAPSRQKIRIAAQFDEGAAARRAGLPITACRVSGELADGWRNGWRDEDARIGWQRDDSRPDFIDTTTAAACDDLMRAITDGMRAEDAGSEARLAGQPVGACPHPEGHLAECWLTGWTCADSDILLLTDGAMIR